jgi:large subunit ribosomal protein L21
MYAVIKLGSEQYKVAEGDTIEAKRLEGEPGDKIEIDQVLMFANGSDIRIGQPCLADVKVSAKLVDQVKGPKTLAVKYRRRKNSSSRVGHRAKLTAVSITKISA